MVFRYHVVLMMCLLPVMREPTRISVRSRCAQRHCRPPPQRFDVCFRIWRPAANSSSNSRLAQAGHPQQIVGAGYKVGLILRSFC